MDDVPPLLWDMVKRYLPASEQEEVARLVGSDLIRSNAEAHQEATALAALLEAVSADNERALAQLALCSNPQRDMLQGEIMLLLQQLGGGDISSSGSSTGLPRRESSVASYVAAVTKISSRPFTASSGSRPSTTASWGSLDRSGGSASSSKGGLEVIRGRTRRYPQPLQLQGFSSNNVFISGSSASFQASKSLLDAVAAESSKLLGASEGAEALLNTLRQALQQEAAALAVCVEQLRAAAEEEADRHSAARVAPPTLDELRATSHMLRAAVDATGGGGACIGDATDSEGHGGTRGKGHLLFEESPKPPKPQAGPTALPSAAVGHARASAAVPLRRPLLAPRPPLEQPQGGRHTRSLRGQVQELSSAAAGRMGGAAAAHLSPKTLAATQPSGRQQDRLPPLAKHKRST